MSNESKIAAIIVTFNRKSLLEKSICGLLNQTILLKGIIIIDTASNDGTFELLKEKEFINNPIIHYYRINDDIGLSSGLAEALRIAYNKGFDWFWLIDDDLVAKKDALQKLVNSEIFFKENTGMLTGIILDEENNPVYRSRPAKRFRLARLKPNIYPNKKDYALPYFRIDRAVSIGMLIPSRVIEKCGFPNKGFFIWHTDLDYSIRINKYFKMYCIPNCQFNHYETMSVSEHAVFGYTYRLIPKNALWKDYDIKRNRIFIQIQYSHLAPALIIILLYLIFWISTSVIYGDAKLQRISITLKAVFDGVSGRLGKISK
jgi:GT2 family glycosyltransferase